MSLTTGYLFRVLCLTTIIPGVLFGASKMKKEFSATELYNGLEARKVILNKTSGRLELDALVFKYGKERQGVAVTDVFDMGPAQGVIALPATVSALTVSADIDVPAETTAKLEIRTGASFFDQSQWSPWVTLETNGGKVDTPAGRYVQLRLTFNAPKNENQPSVGKITVDAEVAEQGKLPTNLNIKETQIEEIVNSTVDFKYERPDHPKIAAFKKAINLDAVVAHGKTDFDKLVLLMDWTGSCHNDRKEHPYRMQGGHYAWDVDRITKVTEQSTGPDNIGKATIFGHCMSYAETMTFAATALGYKSRHVAVVGFREASHEVVEAWVPSMKKWIYFDPSLSNYYMDKDTGEPLNMVEMHNVVLRAFVPDGKDVNWFIQRNSQETRDIVKKVGGKTPIKSRLGPWRYGEPMDPDYDWGWYHGYLISGFLQITPRTDYHANPEANPKEFENLPGYGGYPFWVDEKTPPRKRVNNWVTRKRDFYWTVDQASVVLTADAKDKETINVELGNSMPFFKNYIIVVNGKKTEQPGNSFAWKLQSGENTLSVKPIDEFGMKGAASTVTLAIK